MNSKERPSYLEALSQNDPSQPLELTDGLFIEELESRTALEVGIDGCACSCSCDCTSCCCIITF